MTDATGGHVWGNTATYEAYMGRWSRPVAEAALAWLGLPPALAWLDVGCGTGALTEVILASADPRKILGVDPSADFLATAVAQIADPRVRFAIGDARALPVPNDAYDAVIAGLVLHFVSDPPPVPVGRLPPTSGILPASGNSPGICGGRRQRSIRPRPRRTRAGRCRCASLSPSRPCLRGPACRP